MWDMIDLERDRWLRPLLLARPSGSTVTGSGGGQS